MKYISPRETPDSFYHELGLKSGLEIHQQLLTEKKLFCRCPAGIYSREWDAEILRHMRPTLSELGEYDGTALMEFKTRKDIIYRLNNTTVCTYEFDDTPPFEINEKALDIALEMTLLLGCSLVAEIHITRKQYLDGSIPAGFQRTTILGVNGSIPYRDRRIAVRQLGLEEDACREVSDRGHVRTYITDRLGMPLIETVTEPQLHTPREVADVAEIIRRLARATGKVRTGSGAARQDVNVSIRGGSRCEIKGVGSIRRIPLLVHNEAFRQAVLLEIRATLRQRGITPETLSAETFSVAGLPSPAQVRRLAGSGRDEQPVAGVLLRGFAGLLDRVTAPGRTFLSEISDRVRVIACIDELPHLLTAEAPEKTADPETWRRLFKICGATDGDAIVLVWGPEADLATAVNEIIIRAREAAAGVPEETRQPRPDGTTRFERILPGANRMYPDTDLPPQAIRDERIECLRRSLPEPPWRRAARYEDDGLHPDLARQLSISRRAPVYDRVRAECPGLLPAFPAALLAQPPGDIERLDEDFWLGLFRMIDAGRFLRDSAIPVIKQALRNGGNDATAIAVELNLEPADASAVAAALDAALAETRGQTFKSPAAALRFAMGRVMRRLRGRVGGQDMEMKLKPLLDARVTA